MNFLERAQATSCRGVDILTKFIDLTGERFERLVVKERAGYNAYKALTWLCVCDCGQTIIVPTGSLKSGSTKSCGCLRKDNLLKISEDMIGRRFGRLVVEKRSGGDKTHKSLWACLCDCGQMTVVPTGGLKSGHTKSCGCFQREQAAKYNLKHGLAQSGKKTAEYSMWLAAKGRAKKLGLAFDLVVEDIVIPKICPVFKIELAANKGLAKDNSPNLDRYNPSEGYVKNNVWVISRKANIIKGGLSPAQLRVFLKVVEEGFKKHLSEMCQ